MDVERSQEITGIQKRIDLTGILGRRVQGMPLQDYYGHQIRNLEIKKYNAPEWDVEIRTVESGGA